MISSRTIAICVAACAVLASPAMAQYAKTPTGPVGPPGGLPGYSPPPMPSMPSAPSTLPPAPAAPDVRGPVIVVPPSPPPPDRSRDAGGTQECDCYRMVDGRRVFTGKNVACCPK